MESPRPESTQDFTAILRNLATRAEAICAPEGAASTEANSGRHVGRGPVVQEDTQDLVALLSMRDAYPSNFPAVPPLPEPLETTENLAALLSAASCPPAALPAQPPFAGAQSAARSADPGGNVCGSAVDSTSVAEGGALWQKPPPEEKLAAPPTSDQQRQPGSTSLLSSVPAVPPPPKTPPLGARVPNDSSRDAYLALSTAALATHTRRAAEMPPDRLAGLASTTPPPASRRHEWGAGAERAALSASLSASTLPTYAGASAFSLATTPTPAAYGVYSLEASATPAQSRLTSRKRIMGAFGGASGDIDVQCDATVAERVAQLKDVQQLSRRTVEEPCQELNEGSRCRGCEPQTPDRDVDRDADHAAGPLRSLWQRLSGRR